MARNAPPCAGRSRALTANAEELRNHLRAGGFSGVVILTGPKNGDTPDQSPLLGREYVQHLVHITRELPEIAGIASPLRRDPLRPDGVDRRDPIWSRPGCGG